MTRRRVLLLGSAAIVAALAVGVWLRWPRQTAITLENGARITPWLPLGKAEEILGGPERDETNGPTEIDGTDQDALFDFHMRAEDIWMRGRQETKPIIRTWQSDNARIDVMFGPAERVVDSITVQVRPVHDSLIDVLRRWLRR